jgi:hypothetical protein
MKQGLPRAQKSVKTTEIGQRLFGREIPKGPETLTDETPRFHHDRSRS